ncbi:molybdopterin synthase catalytic subunit MoaE [Iodobacter sp. CM08]|uniref:molybdopterin synthase catalytic subunit MoaE n=1 Tax=Iodobacter sp. CM08 TaxID=3085902 RepID=UPI0029814A6B|nr:molybdopterin synthase catalytic subunit MoaE [Iodobacter sp. CM08]MDW5415395.1 molybdopterin synthase catalytic subunit MoaE [Iodobacter sp. CM08]
MADIRILVQSADFDLAAEYARFDHDASMGAIVAFVGRVRDLDQSITAMHLEHYPGMTEKALAKIVAEACQYWPLQAVTVIHRIGALQAAEQIVLVLTAAKHRQAAYEANAFIMDFLKTQAPFWKKEGTAACLQWVDARSSDQSALDRWQYLRVI